MLSFTRTAEAASCSLEVQLDVSPRAPDDGALLSYTLSYCEIMGFPADVFDGSIAFPALTFVPGTARWTSCPTGNCRGDGSDALSLGAFSLVPAECVTFTLEAQLEPGQGGRQACAQEAGNVMSHSPPNLGACPLRSDDATTAPLLDKTCVQVIDPSPGCSVTATVTPALVYACAGVGDTLSAVTSAAVGCSGGALTYQWLLGGVPIQDATSDTYVIPTTQPQGIYHYACRVACADAPACQDISNDVWTNLTGAGIELVAPEAACVGTPVQVYVQNGYECTIDCGDGSAPVADCVTTCSYPALGTHSIHVEASDGTCTEIVTRDVEIISGAVACLDLPDMICEDEDGGSTRVPITSCSPAALGFTWSTNLGRFDDPTSPTPTLNLPDVSVTTSVRVTLRVTAPGCGPADVETHDFLLEPAPDVTALAEPLESCDGDPVSFTAQVAGAGPFAWAWDFGDGTTSTDPAPVHVPSGAGTFDVSVAVTDLVTGCRKVSHPGPVVVHSIPDAGPTAAPSPACPGQDVVFGAVPQGPGPFTWAWDFGDGTTSDLDSPTHAFATPGAQDVRVTLVDVATGCSSTKPLVVMVLTPTNPVACITQPASGCEDAPDGPSVVSLSSCSDPGLVHAWSASLGSLDDPSSPSPLLTLPDVATLTTVTVTLQVVDPADPCSGGATTMSSFDLRALPRAVIRALPDPACAGEIVSFTANPSQGIGPYSHEWDFGDGTTSTSASPTHVYAADGPRVVTLTLMDLATACATVIPSLSLDVLACNPNTCLYRAQVVDRHAVDRLATFLVPPTPQGVSLQGAPLRCPFQSGDVDANVIGDGMTLTFYQVDDPLRVMTLRRVGSDIRFVF